MATQVIQMLEEVRKPQKMSAAKWLSLLINAKLSTKKKEVTALAHKDEKFKKRIRTKLDCLFSKTKCELFYLKDRHHEL